MVGIGGLFILGGGYFPETIPQVFGSLSVLLAFVNVGGGFVITKRMLDMFKRKPLASVTEQDKEFSAYQKNQDRLIRQSTLGCMEFRPSSLVAGTSRQQPLEPLVWYRLDIWSALYYASARFPAWLRRRRLEWAICSECLALGLVSWHHYWLSASRPRC